MKAILFDLDGTLIDTAPDLARVLNELRLKNKLPELPFKDIREQVSEGALALIRLGFDISADHPKYLHLRSELLNRYEASICEASVLFPGLLSALESAEAKNVPWGIVTNKPRHLSERLLNKMKLSKRCSVLVCPEDVQEKKPAPEPLIKAAETLNLQCEDIVYVGDHARDIEAAKAANMISVAVDYGYLLPDDNSLLWGADFHFKSSHDLSNWIQQKLDQSQATL